MKNLVSNYFQAKQAIYDHVGFIEDWVICPISDETEYYWNVDLDRAEGEQIIYSLSDITIRHYLAGIDVIDYDNGMEIYSCALFQQYFYKKWIYQGDDFTLIFLNPRVDGMRYYGIFDNSKEIFTKEYL